MRRQPSAVLQLRVADALDRSLVVARLRGQIEENVVLGMPRLSALRPRSRRELRVCVRIVQIAGEIKEILGELGPEAFVEGRVLEKLVERLLHLFAERLVSHTGPRVADDGEARREAALIGETVESGNQFALGQIAVGAENDDGARRYTTLKPQRILKRISFGHSLAG